MLGAAVVCALLTCPQQTAPFRVHAADPLHHSVELVALDGRAAFEFTTTFDGTLHVWAESEVIVPSLLLRYGQQQPPFGDNNSGGGTTAYLELEVSSHERCIVTVGATTARDSGPVQLHWVASPETEETRATAKQALIHLKQLDALRADGDRDAARALLETTVSLLEQPEAAGLSHEISWAASDLISSAWALGATQARHVLCSIVRRHRERVLPRDHPHLINARQNLAGALKLTGDVAGSHALFRDVVEARERLQPEDHPDLVRARASLASTSKKLGDLPGARALEEAVLESRQRSLPEGHPDLLRARRVLAITLRKLGDLPGAHALQVALLEGQETLHTKGSLDVLHARANLAVTIRMMGDFAGARELQENVLEGLLKDLPEDHPHVLSAKHNLAITLYRMGILASARKLCESVLQARELVLPEDHPDLISARNNLANTLSDMGDLAGAHALFEAALEACRRSLPESHPDLAIARGSLAVVMTEMGDLQGARALLETTLEACAQLPEAHPVLLSTRENLAVVMLRMGDVAAARVFLESVLEAREILLPDSHPELLISRSNLAVCKKKMGDYQGARALEEGVLEARERAFSDDHPHLLSARVNLAITLRQMGDLAGSRALSESVLAARQRLLPESHPALAIARETLAITMKHEGDLAGARALQEAVLETYERLLPDDHPHLSSARHNLASTMASMGNLPEAIALQEAVLDSRERVMPDDHEDLLSARLNLGVNMLLTGDLERASTLSRELGGGLLRRLESISVLSPREVREAAGKESLMLSILAFFDESLGSEGPGAFVFSLVETWRRTISAPIPAATAGQPEVRALAAAALKLRKRLNGLVAGGPERGQSPKAFSEEVARLSLERDRLERRLRDDLMDHGVPVQPVVPEQVAASLARDAAAVGYRVLPGWRLDRETQEHVPRGDLVLAHVVTADGSWRRIDLGAASELEALIRAWRAGLGKGIGRGVSVDSPRDHQAVEQQAGEALAEWLLAPVLAVLDAECTRLHVCSDDLLHLVPLDALPFEGERVGDRWTVVNEVSLGRLMDSRPAVDEEPSLLALGGADFEAALDQLAVVAGVVSAPIDGSADRSGAPSNFAPLENTRREVQSIATLFEEHLAGKTVVLSGVDATKAAFHEMAPGKRFLHLATHGWFAPEVVLSMLDVGEQGGSFNRMSASETVLGLAPGTLCGLAFAGANQGRDAIGRVPGIMTAEELRGIDLAACDLAVLSACDTNVGMRRAGQGIQSLQAALHAAGVRTAITSLWEVDDAATRKLMELFYTYLWVEKLGKAEALWKAKCELREEGHPLRDWAAWVLSGDPD